MSLSHHPSEALLLDYALGSLAEGWSLAVAAHLSLCPCVATGGRNGGLGRGVDARLPTGDRRRRPVAEVAARMDAPDGAREVAAARHAPRASCRRRSATTPAATPIIWRGGGLASAPSKWF